MMSGIKTKVHISDISRLTNFNSNEFAVASIF